MAEVGVTTEDGRTIYATGWSLGTPMVVYRSTDGGQKWHLVNAGVAAQVTTAQARPDGALLGYADAGDGLSHPVVYVSENGGQSFVPLDGASQGQLDRDGMGKFVLRKPPTMAVHSSVDFSTDGGHTFRSSPLPSGAKSFNGR
jgi:hypothetical protein